MEIKLENSYRPQERKILILCLKQGNKNDGIYFYAMDLIRELAVKNTVTVVGNKDFQKNINPDVKKKLSIMQFQTYEISILNGRI